MIFVGAQNHEELRTAYASADIFAMPSVTARDGDTEGFGLVLLEEILFQNHLNCIPSEIL